MLFYTSVRTAASTERSRNAYVQHLTINKTLCQAPVLMSVLSVSVFIPAVINTKSTATYCSTSGTITSSDNFDNFQGIQDMTFVISPPKISKIKLTVTDFYLGWCDTTCKCNTSCPCSALQVSYTLCDAVKQPKCLTRLKMNSRCNEDRTRK
jgi:hypothetical protein